MIYDKEIFPSKCSSKQQIHKIIRGLVVTGPFMATKECEWNATLFELNQYTVHIGYSDNTGGIDFWAKLSLYPINYVWVSWRRGFIPII